MHHNPARKKHLANYTLTIINPAEINVFLAPALKGKSTTNLIKIFL
jgi:hypothetical protein